MLALVLTSFAVFVTTASTAQAAQPVPGHTRVVPETVRTNTPVISDGEITDLAYIGTHVYIAGTFTSIRNHTSTNTTSYAQPSLASYNLTTGLVDTGFRPTFAGGQVTEIEASPDGTKLFVVGKFNTVDGVTRRKVAAINPTTGALITTFKADANSAATAVEATNSTVYIGGQFTTINGTPRVGLAAVNSTTGAVISGFQNDLAGGIGVNGALQVQALVLTPDESKLLVVHTGRQIAGQDRYGVGLISTSTNQLLPWSTTLWQDNLVFIGGIQRAYAAAISPDGSYFVVTAGSGGDRPPISDTAVRFNFDGNGTANEKPVWVTRVFDSVYSVAISEVAIYLGGHFNWLPSPTAPSPWPGLDNVGYGWGQGLSGYALGDQVVRREHLGAIDPATGHALEWSPESNSFEGNKAMLVTPRGLIAGGDATTQGGQNVGRVAVFEWGSIPAPNGNETTITAPIEGRVVPSATPFQVTGTATATSGVRRVQLTIQERDTKQYLQPDLTTWGASTTINPTLAAPNATSTNWSLNLNIPGNHRIQVLATTVGRDGTKDNTKASKKFETFGLTDQTPNTTITGPSSGVPVPSLTFTVTGTATDDVGVNAVSLTFRDANNKYLQNDGTADFGYNSFRVTPDVVGATSTTWSYEVTVPYESQWTMQSLAIDTAGQSNLRSTDRTWVVSLSAVAPSVAITSPATMIPPTTTAPLTVAPGAPLTFSGSATDDKNLNYVEIQLRNNSTREYLGADGSWSANNSSFGWYRVSPAAGLTTASYNWSYTTPFNLSPGSYVFSVRAADDEGLVTPTANRGTLTVNAQVPGDAFPDGTITPAGTTTAQTATSMHLDLAGAATDDKGVSAVRVSLRDSNTAMYVQPDGSLTSSFTTVNATLASPGATSTTWSLPLDLKSQGTYTVTAIAVDTAGQQDPDTTTATSRWMVYPGDLPPTSTDTLLAPTEGTVFTGAKILVSGRLEDDQQIAQGQVAIVNSLGQYMSTTGTFTSTTESWRTAYLNSPGSPGSNFSYTTPAIPAGNYTVYVRGVDQHGQITPAANYGVRHVTVAPPASNPPVAKIVTPVSCAANVCTFDGRTSTDENTATLTYAWNFGDGTTGTGPLPVHTYTRPGAPFTVTLTVTDEYALNSAPVTTTVTITEPAGNAAPAPVLNPPSCAGLVCNFSAVGTTDPNTGDVITYSWNFGDGSALGTVAALAHTFPATGTYTVTLTATDGWGKSASTTRTLTF